MSVITAFRPIPGGGLAVAASVAAVSIGGVVNSQRRIRVAWVAGPGFFALGSDATQRSGIATEKISLPTVTGVEYFEVGSNQSFIDSTIALTLNVGA